MTNVTKYIEALHKDASYDQEAKAQFHNAARTMLKRLKARLDIHGGYGKASAIRSNKGGIAVSGEVTLHFDRLYIQVSQSSMGSKQSILYRSCTSREDYTGGRNHFTPLDAFSDIEQFAKVIESDIPMTMGMSDV